MGNEGAAGGPATGAPDDRHVDRPPPYVPDYTPQHRKHDSEI
jgi:hypothetical protein